MLLPLYVNCRKTFYSTLIFGDYNYYAFLLLLAIVCLYVGWAGIVCGVWGVLTKKKTTINLRENKNKSHRTRTFGGNWVLSGFCLYVYDTLRSEMPEYII